MKKYFYYLIISVFFIATISSSNTLYNFAKNFYRFLFGRSSVLYLRSFNNSKIFLGNTNYHPDSSLVFITYGQSNAANSGKMDKSLKVWNNVYMIYEGNIYIYKDPTLGAQGQGASVWGLLGKEIIAKSEGRIKNVFFTNTAVGGAPIEKLISNGDNFLNYFLDEFKLTLNKFGKIDGVLFHQGEQNNKNAENYYKSFSTLQDSINSIKQIPIYLSQASYCSNVIDQKLLDIQDSLIINKKLVLRGPNTDILGDQFRYDNCHFNSNGLLKLSTLWYQAIDLRSEK